MGKNEFTVLHHLRGAENYAALDFLASVLNGPGGHVQLVYVEERIPDIEDDSRRKLARKQCEKTERPDSEDLVNRAKERLEKIGPDFSVSFQTTFGDPVEEVLGQLGRGGYDLLSLEAHGRGGFRKNILGAHVNELVQEAPIPTMVHKGELKECERILIHVPNDRNRCAGLITYFADLFRGSEPAITFLTILEDEDEKFEGYISGEEDYLKESIENYDRDEFGYLNIARKILDENEMEAEVRYRIGDTREEILTEAKEGRYDLMAFSPEKENILSSLWSGDKSLKLMQEIDISFLKYLKSA
ncbi:universal stress protein [Candidatus Bipolaricaulota bacterium]|nr:universal stress protein [Candidatus Bipolaricaulota bacterium]